MSILVLTSDTLSSPAAAGQIEYTSPIFAATPIGTQRGIVPTQQYYRLDTAYVGTNVATAQTLFNVGVTLSSSTVYEFEAVYYMGKTAGTTSHTIGFGFGGTATINNTFWNAMGADTTSAFPIRFTTIQIVVSNSLANVVWSGASAAATINLFANVKGTVSINAGGTFIPQYTLSAAPGGAYTTQIGSFIRINPLSASGAATNVGTWS